ncbi:hypothetical protein [Rhodococcus sp. 105337]|jgi:hypothetical protein|uniref:hypothetical protein n=1 Tax=Rhodococcus sp. 105337 TaxID=2725310 RepID=UPI00146D6CC3|nr:hypothetical protein [Rhodococcus sp. 105337]NME77823.1 hypothetical protein [Rhodococcus sp. 105337]
MSVADHKDPETTSTEHGSEDAAPDVVSDPARSTEGESTEWTTEGGATPAGPATETENSEEENS